MDQELAAQQFENNLKRNVRRITVVSFAVIAILMAFPAVILRWRTFSTWTRFDAVVFLLLLVLAPVFDLLAEKAGRERFERFPTSVLGYILTMLAIVLFARP
jgi:hypothetical protein